MPRSIAHEILAVFPESGELFVGQIVTASGKPRGTVTYILRRLVALGLLAVRDEEPEITRASGRNTGRRYYRLTVPPALAHARLMCGKYRGRYAMTTAQAAADAEGRVRRGEVQRRCSSCDLIVWAPCEPE